MGDNDKRPDGLEEVWEDGVLVGWYGRSYLRDEGDPERAFIARREVDVVADRLALAAKRGTPEPERLP